MQTVAADTAIDMVDHEELLILFQHYVATCIEESTPSSRIRPISFDDWHRAHFLEQIEDHTVVISVTLSWETASHGYLCGSASREYRLRVPAMLFTESGAIVDDDGVKRIARKFVRTMNARLPDVSYRGASIYRWTWD